jgi:hypothetical protein
VEDSKSKASTFYKPGATLFGVKIAEIQMDHLDVTDAADKTVPLKMGRAGVFEEGKHVP